MLLAVEMHPAMLLYLDNVQSIGPHSFAGQRRGKGINENLAREIMELHTIGVRSGYSQADVTNFAKVITGWSIVPLMQESGGVFVFNERLHEPGAERIMGHDYDDGGFEQGRAVLLALAQVRQRPSIWRVSSRGILLRMSLRRRWSTGSQSAFAIRTVT